MWKTDCWKLGLSSDKGPVKRTNEDFASFHVVAQRSRQAAIAVVADGMGGYQAGDVASRVAVESVMDWWRSEAQVILDNSFAIESLTEALNKRLFEINGRLVTMGQNREIRMGTTLSILLLLKGTYVIAHVGDSRVYKYGNESHTRLLENDETEPLEGNLMQLTVDHSWVQSQVSLGALTKEQARNHKKRNVLIHCLGIHPEFNVFITKGSYGPDDVFLLCSDGFHASFSDDQMCSMIQNSNRDESDLQTKSDDFVRSAALAGATDNITVILVKHRYGYRPSLSRMGRFRKGFKHHLGGL